MGDTWRQEVREKARETRSRALAENTWSNRKTSLNHWIRFCKLIGIGEIIWLDTQDREQRFDTQCIFSEFLYHLTMTVKAVEGPGMTPSGTLAQYTSDIVKLHEIVDVDLSCVTKVTKEYCKGREVQLVDIRGPRLKAKKNGFTIEIMADWERVDWTPFLRQGTQSRRTLVIRAIYQTSFACHWRRSDSTIKDGKTWHPNWHLSRNNVRWFSEEFEEIEPTFTNLQRLRESRRGYAWVRSPPGKNDRTGEGATARFPSLLPLSSPSWFCPGLALLDMEIEHFIEPQWRSITPLFTDPDTQEAFRTQDFDSILMRIIQAAYRQIRGKEYSIKQIRKFFSLHSFRIGGMNAIRATSAPSHVRKMAGRWLSDAIDEYDRTELMEMLHFMHEMQGARGVLVTGRPDDLPCYEAERNMEEAGYFQVGPGEMRTLRNPSEGLRFPETHHPIHRLVGKDFKLPLPMVSGENRYHPDGQPMLRAVFCRIASLDFNSPKPITLAFRQRSRPNMKLSLTEWAQYAEHVRTQVAGTNTYVVNGDG